MREATLVAPVEKKEEKRINLTRLRERVEEVLRTNDRAGACALLPDLRVLGEKLRSVRSRCFRPGDLGFSEFVIAVAALAGRRDEFGEFAESA